MEGGRKAARRSHGREEEKGNGKVNRGHMMEYRELFKAFCHR